MSGEGGETGERQLWCAVINQAVIDYRCTLPKMALEQKQAESWFRNNGKDFRTVCELAGLNPDKIREKVLKIGKGMHNETTFEF